MFLKHFGTHLNLTSLGTKTHLIWKRIHSSRCFFEKLNQTITLALTQKMSTNFEGLQNFLHRRIKNKALAITKFVTQSSAMK